MTSKLQWNRVWPGLRLFLGIMLTVYVLLVLIRIPAVLNKRHTAQVVADIHATRLTMNDVTGVHLPLAPDPLVNKATLAGVDANHNGIRDDVELGIFALHPGTDGASVRLRAAELQYAQALQHYMTGVTNSETLVAAMQEDERGSFCIRDSIPKPKQDAPESAWIAYFGTGNGFIKDIKQNVLYDSTRKGRYDQVFSKYMVSYGSISEVHCDISL